MRDSMVRQTSTMAIRVPSIAKGDTSSRKRIDISKSRRRVEFDESKNQVHETEPWTSDDFRRRWYRKSEYQAMKDASYSLVKQVGNKENQGSSDSSYNSVVLRAYDACCRSRREEGSDQMTNILSPIEQEDLRKVVGKAKIRTGLEKIFIREIKKDKFFRRHEVVRRASQVQAFHKAGNVHTQDELVRMASESVTRTSRLFAHCMAVALAESLCKRASSVHLCAA